MIKLILSDMDGTLMPFGNEHVSQRTLEAITSLLDAGIFFGPSSGREPHDLLARFHGDERCVATGIYGNGKVIYIGGERVFQLTLDADELDRLVATLHDIDGCFFTFYNSQTAGEQNATTDPAKLFSFVDMSERDRELASKDALVKLPRESLPAIPRGLAITTGAVFCSGDKAHIEEVRTILEAACPGFDFVLPGNNVFDVLPKGWTKVSALPVLERELGITREQIVYIGDSENDLTMLEEIPHSFCVANGTAAAQAAARWIIDADVDDAPAQLMEELAQSGGRMPERFC
ncbi:MAG: HAD family phosphatase [Atopobiaceae bacterium]|nr:HAD family phosphatase [Atopobiaceae bacterium]